VKDKNKALGRIIWSVISIMLAFFTIYAIMKQNRNVTFGQLVTFVSDSNITFFMISVLAAASYVWFEGLAIRTILCNSGIEKKRSECLVYSTSDVYFSAITPSATGGQPASAFFMIKDGVPAGLTTAALVLNLIMYNASLGVLGLMAVIISPGTIIQFGGISKAFILFGTIVLILLSLFFFIVLKNGKKIFDSLCGFVLLFEKKKIIKSADKAVIKLKKMGEEYSDCSVLISGKPALLAKVFLWNFIQRASQILVPMFLFLSAGGNIRLASSVFSGQCLINIGYNYVPIPGGMGVSDYLMLDGFRNIMGTDMAYQVEMISRGITFYLCVIVCGIITLAGYLIRRRK
jgi:uncharacterized protein (TIRG00374 family)